MLLNYPERPRECLLTDRLERRSRFPYGPACLASAVYDARRIGGLLSYTSALTGAG
jgi:hypothetical protein